MNIKGFVIAGTGSGSGKTTAAVAIMAFLKEKGYRVAPFKVGPDFIDPGYHKAVTGQISRNLDSWMMSKEYNKKIFSYASKDADISVVEGVMGLFDGYSGISEAGSTSEMAKLLNLPVILIVDARSMARSAAAIVQGFENFDKNLTFAGVIFNKTGSIRHYEYLKEAVEDTCRMPCLGFLLRNEKIIFPERHLGLVTTDEHLIASDTIAELISMVDENTCVENFVKNLPDIKDERSSSMPFKACSSLSFESHSLYLHKQDKESKNFRKIKKCSKIRIAVARDKAFCFYYQGNMELLQQNGAEIVNFSPMEDLTLPEDIDGIYLGGGYPELFAKQLSENKGLLREIRQKSLKGMPVYGECGGFMYLCSSMSGMTPEDKFPMAGCFPFSIILSKKMRSLGYREITLTRDTLIGKKGDVLRGHEFHYSCIDNFNIPDNAGDYYGNNAYNSKNDTGKDNAFYTGNHADAAGNDDRYDSGNDSGNNSENDSGNNNSLPENVYHVSGRNGQKLSLNGFQTNNTLGSYLHIHFGSASRSGAYRSGTVNQAALSFVNSCLNFKKGCV